MLYYAIIIIQMTKISDNIKVRNNYYKLLAISVYSELCFLGISCVV